MRCRVVDDERGLYLVSTEYQAAAGYPVWGSLERILKEGLKVKHGDIIEIKKENNNRTSSK